MNGTSLGRLLRSGALALAGTLAAWGGASADTIKVGIIGPFSGPFALQGKNFQAGAEAWLAQNGKTVAGHDIELVYRDLPTANPQQARALAQELIVKDKVQYLGGVYFTPGAPPTCPACSSISARRATIPKAI